MIKHIFERSLEWPDYLKSSALLGIAGLAVLLIRSAQDKNSRAIQLKLDQLIIARDQEESQGTPIEDLTVEESEQLQKFYKKLEHQRRQKMLNPDEITSETYYRYK